MTAAVAADAAANFATALAQLNVAVAERKPDVFPPLGVKLTS